jgi:hypothetical protein
MEKEEIQTRWEIWREDLKNCLIFEDKMTKFKRLCELAEETRSDKVLPNELKEWALKIIEEHQNSLF